MSVFSWGFSLEFCSTFLSSQLLRVLDLSSCCRSLVLKPLTLTLWLIGVCVNRLPRWLPDLRALFWGASSENVKFFKLVPGTLHGSRTWRPSVVVRGYPSLWRLGMKLQLLFFSFKFGFFKYFFFYPFSLVCCSFVPVFGVTWLICLNCVWERERRKVVFIFFSLLPFLPQFRIWHMSRVYRQETSRIYCF